MVGGKYFCSAPRGVISWTPQIYMGGVAPRTPRWEVAALQTLLPLEAGQPPGGARRPPSLLSRLSHRISQGGVAPQTFEFPRGRCSPDPSYSQQ